MTRKHLFFNIFFAIGALALLVSPAQAQTTAPAPLLETHSFGASPKVLDRDLGGVRGAAPLGAIHVPSQPMAAPATGLNATVEGAGTGIAKGVTTAAQTPITTLFGGGRSTNGRSSYY